jgi:hypothetical protein
MPRTSPLPTGETLHHEAAPGRRYVLPGASLSDFGVWEYVPCTPEQARAWLLQAPYVSCLGDHEMALALTRLVDVDVPKGRWRVVRLQPEDDALVYVLARGELGWLKRLA